VSDIAWTVGRRIVRAFVERHHLLSVVLAELTNVGGADTFCRCHPTAACKPPSELAS